MSEQSGFRRNLFTNCSLGLVAAWAALASPAAAQAPAEQAPEDTSAIGEIVVTAQFRAQNLQEVPLAISAITADDIEDRGFTESADIGYIVPNASLRPAQAAFGNTMTALSAASARTTSTSPSSPASRSTSTTCITRSRSVRRPSSWISSAWKCCADRKVRCSAAAPSGAPFATSASSRRAAATAVSKRRSARTTA